MKGRVDNGKSERIPDGRTERRLRAVLRGTELPCSGARDSADQPIHTLTRAVAATTGTSITTRRRHSSRSAVAATTRSRDRSQRSSRPGRPSASPADTKHWHGAAPRRIMLASSLHGPCGQSGIHEQRMARAGGCRSLRQTCLRSVVLIWRAILQKWDGPLCCSGR